MSDVDARYLGLTANQLAKIATDLKAENAKLREYAKLMHTHIKVCCDACGECGFCDIDALTRELGIEVG